MASLLSADTLAARYLGELRPTDADSMAVLGEALETVESLVATYLGYPGVNPSLASATYTLRLSRLTSTRVTLPLAPVSSITSVAQSDSFDFLAAYSAISASNYELVPLKNGAYIDLKNGYTWLSGSRVIQVICVGGYADEAAMPRVLADAIYRTAADWYARRSSRTTQSSSGSGSSVSYAPLSELPVDVQTMLARWVLLGTWGVS